MTEPSRAVFVSYASQDAAAAQRICEALREAGLEVWFDQSELRGGDAWDRRIREQIHDCRLFVAVISAHTEARDEGYFRREWKLAVDRTHDMAENKAFIVPVVIDGTSERGAAVPEKFRELQWTRLPNGETPLAFVKRMQRLLSPEPSATIRAPASAQSGTVGVIRAPVQKSWSPKRGLLIAVVAVLSAVAYLAIEKLRISKPAASSPTVAASASPAAFSPPPHSIAVLPFVNLSEDKEQEYFSEGLTEELLNSLAEINGLQVAARTSSFSFQGEHPDIATVAHKLNVASVLEGSVRRSGHTVRITAQLINAVTGFHLWSKTYDRDLRDVLKLQTEIATAVADALKVTLLGDVSQKIELGGTQNPAAFDAYLRASKASHQAHDESELSTAIAEYTEAIRLDPSFALAFAARSIGLTLKAGSSTTEAAIREGFEKAERDARQAIALAPELAHAHVALGFVSEATLDFARANEEYQRALALAPGSARALRESGTFAVFMGHFDTGVAALRRAVVLDPLSVVSHSSLAAGLYAARRYGEAVTAYSQAISLEPDFKPGYAWRGLAFYGLGDLEPARASCETKRDYWASQLCLSVVYDKLGRHADAEAERKKLQDSAGDTDAYLYAAIYAQWGDRRKALDWLDTAMRLRDPGLEFVKTEPLLDPLRNEPRFQAVERQLRFPTS